MSDYSFMKTGSNNSQTNTMDIDIKNIEVLLSVFITNAIKNAAKYIKICNRNGITKYDIVHGLRYEVFEFLNRKSLNEEINKALDEPIPWNLEEDELLDEMDENDMIIPDNELDDFKRMESELVKEEDKEFVEKFHNYYDTWNNWIPETPMNKILKNAIDKSNI
jgi:hypothetical protein